MREIFWAGTHEGAGNAKMQGDALTARLTVALNRFTAIRHDTYGSVGIDYYNIPENTEVVIIAIDGVRTGFGIPCTTLEETKNKLSAAQHLLKVLGIGATAEAFKLSHGPAQAA